MGGSPFSGRPARDRPRRPAAGQVLRGVRRGLPETRVGSHGVYRQGDAQGKPFIFPRPVIHLTDEFFRTPGHEAFLEDACATAAAKGNPCFVLDRQGGTPLAPCGCLDIGGEDGGSGEPWRRRCASIQNVTLNLPRLGYRSGEGDANLFASLAAAAELAVKAHVQKRDFIEKLLALGDAGPLAMLAMQSDAAPYLRLRDATFLVGWRV